MSYDVHVEIDAGGPEPMTAGDWNYTSNCGGMFSKAAGTRLPALDGMKAADALEIMRRAVKAMEDKPDEFRAMNPANGWGDYESFLDALRRLVALFARYPKATVKVWA